ncbi:carcinoembryonic antigen-related cell adhesion molecule 2-like [Narcine bancroftii]|uniref:carcinoembryonic antigen-related cell adhesion molecule 2-like n=1 Tax=Narcine bancroftii TaxID=1343680 RepID=UPI0038321F33
MESVLTGCFMVWSGDTSTPERKALQKKAAALVVGTTSGHCPFKSPSVPLHVTKQVGLVCAVVSGVAEAGIKHRAQRVRKRGVGCESSPMGRAPLRNLVWLIVLTVSWVFPGAEAPPVEVTVGANPVQTGTGWNATLSVASASQLFQVDWNDPEGNSILTRINGEDFVKPGTPYTNRVSLLANGSLVIASVQLSDEGNYSVKMEPQSVEGLTPNTVSIELLVYVPVRGVRVRFSRTGTPEGTAEISIACTFTAGSRLSFSWLKDGNPLSSTGRVNVSGTPFASSRSAARMQEATRAGRRMPCPAAWTTDHLLCTGPECQPDREHRVYSEEHEDGAGNHGNHPSRWCG